MSMNPLQLAFYKGLSGKHGALQFNEQRPHYYIKDRSKFKNYDGKFIKKEWLQDPDWDLAWTEKDLVSREGALFLEITSTKGNNVYDWENKIIMALSIQDIGKLLTVLDGTLPSVKLLHDPGAKTTNQGKVTKTVEFSSPKGLVAGVIVRASEKKAGEEEPKLHMVPLSPDEAKILRCCLEYAIPKALAW